MNLIKANIEELRNACVRHNVVKLYVFGSAAKGELTEKSDIDFLVTFASIDLKDYSDNYFDFKFLLEKIFQRKIDLLEEKAIKNPYLKSSINKTKSLIYGREN